MSAATLECPRCARRYAASERFCADCALPLVTADVPVRDEADSEAHAWARRIDRRYTEGELVRVAGARNLSEAELVQGLLLDEGVPSVLRRSRGFDVPDLLAAGPRDVLVPESGLQVARTLLSDTGLGGGPAPSVSISPWRLGLGLLIGLLVLALLVWAGSALGH